MRADRFTGKVAVITGGASGIGLATAEGFAGEGGKVVIADVDDAAANALATKLSKGPGEAVYIKTDVTKPESFQATIEQTIKKFGTINCLVNNAGGGRVQYDGIKMSIEDWNFILNYNLTSCWVGMVAASEHMKTHGGGSIVNISSMGAIRHTVHHNMAYAAAKAGMIRITEMAAFRLSQDNIRVNCVAPGVTLTPAARGALDKDMLQTAISQESALPRLAVPEDQAAAILYLLSDEASYVSGQTIRVDGGWYTK